MGADGDEPGAERSPVEGAALLNHRDVHTTAAPFSRAAAASCEWPSPQDLKIATGL